MGADNVGIKLNVFAQIQCVGNIVHPLFYLWLVGKSRAPAPVLVQIFGKEVLIDVGLGVEFSAGISVPIPCASDSGCDIVCSDIEALTAQHMELIEPGNARADNECVKLLAC